MESKPFVLKANYQPAGDQPQAIAKLLEGIRDGFRHQTLLGVTGSGKTGEPHTRARGVSSCQMATCASSAPTSTVGSSRWSRALDQPT